MANTLVGMYAKCGDIKTASNVFDKICKPDVVSLTAMVAGYAQKKYVDEALEHFQGLPQRDVFLWTAIIAGCEQNGQGEGGSEAFSTYEISRDSKAFASVLREGAK